jgi:hypothetical protein
MHRYILTGCYEYKSVLRMNQLEELLNKMSVIYFDANPNPKIVGKIKIFTKRIHEMNNMKYYVEIPFMTEQHIVTTLVTSVVGIATQWNVFYGSAHLPFTDEWTSLTVKHTPIKKSLGCITHIPRLSGVRKQIECPVRYDPRYKTKQLNTIKNMSDAGRQCSRIKSGMQYNKKNDPTYSFSYNERYRRLAISAECAGCMVK